MMQKIIFLDIDGPVITDPLFFLSHDASVKRSVLNTQALAYLVALCDAANAKIVTNSTHNNHVVEHRTLKDDLIRWGVDEKYFHKNWRTQFPEYWGDNGRLRGIHDWMLENNGEHVDWICFDDAFFTDSERLIVVDARLGIDYKAYSQALKYWGISEPRLDVPLW